MPAASSTAPRNTAVAARAVPTLVAATGATGQVGGGDGDGGVGEADDATGSSREAQSAPAPDCQPHRLRRNGICIPASVVKDNVDDFVAYNFFVQHCLSPEATDDYLRQRRAAGTCRTSHLLNNMVAASVDLYD